MIELKFKYRAIREILETFKVSISQLDEVSVDFTKVGTIGYIGHKHAGGKLTLDEIEDMIDENSELIKYIFTEFQTQAVNYLTNPNAKSQLPLSN